MSQYNFGDTYFDIKDTDTIWILAPGPSFDFFDMKQVKPEHIVITSNSMLSYYDEPDFHIGSDGAAINGYVKYYKPKTVWFTKKKNESLLIKQQIKCLSLDDLIERHFSGSGSDQMLLAYYLCEYQSLIQHVHYVGIDFSEIVCQGQNYYYSSKVEVLDWQEKLQLPVNWHKDKKYSITSSTFSSYCAQLSRTVKYLKSIPGFKKKLISHSYMDFNFDRPVLKNNRFGTPAII